MSDALSELLLSEDIPKGVAKAYRSAKVLLSPQEVDQAVDRLAVRLTVELQDRNPLLLLSLPDALVLGGMLMRRLVFPLQVGFLSVIGEQVSWVGDADPLKPARPWVMVFNDARTTLAATVQSWVAAQSPLQSYCVSMFAGGATQQDRQHTALPIVAEGCFGSGQPVLGYGANLAGVYQLSDESKEA